MFFIVMFLIAPLTMIYAQKKEIAQAKDNIKAGKALQESENAMRKLLAVPENRSNEKIWLVLYDAVKKQYETVNEKMYLKQQCDTAQLFATTYRMFGILEGLDSVDATPSSDGKVKLNYRKRHAEQLNLQRTNLYNGGLFYMSKKDYQKAFDCFAAYVDCANQPLFTAYNYLQTDKRLPNAAFYAVYNGYKTQNARQTLRYSELAQQDTARLALVYQYMADTYIVQKDTANSLKVLQCGFDRFPRSGYFFSHLFDYYFKNNDVEHALELCDKAINADTLNMIAMFAKSTIMLNQKKYDECIALSDKIISLNDKHAAAYLNAGLAYFNQAVEIDNSKKYSRETRAHMIDLYKKALPYLQTYRKLSPDDSSKWAMPLYTVYLNLNMGKEFDEINHLIIKTYKQ